MNVILLTVFIGLVLVGFFVAFFLNQRRHAVASSPERDSLLPLEEEGFTKEGQTGKEPEQSPGNPDVRG
jgi:hypothetical protein